MRFQFAPAPKPAAVESRDWLSWTWQMQKSPKTLSEFSDIFTLSELEKMGFDRGQEIFNIRTTPYYASLAMSQFGADDPLRKILMPSGLEVLEGAQALLDPLGEKKSANNPASRIVHRYSDRVLFLVTDICSTYCRYCTRKHFTGQDQALIKGREYEEALGYLRKHTGIREVILSGGDPLTLSDSQLERILTDLRAIEHIEIIRIGTRMPVVAPMRITESSIIPGS